MRQKTSVFLGLWGHDFFVGQASLWPILALPWEGVLGKATFWTQGLAQMEDPELLPRRGNSYNSASTCQGHQTGCSHGGLGRVPSNHCGSVCRLWVTGVWSCLLQLGSQSGVCPTANGQFQSQSLHHCRVLLGGPGAVGQLSRRW